MLRPHSSQQTRLSQQVRPIPQTILKSELLALSVDDLDAALQRELDENPALERIDEGSDPAAPAAGEGPWPGVSQRGNITDATTFNRDDDALPDWQEIAGAEDGVLAHLEAQLLPSLPARLRRVAEYYLGSLDARGYLQTTVEDVANETGVSWEDANLVLERLHACEPPGVGARSLRECLLLQLRHPENPCERMARSILEAHFDDFVARRMRSLCRSLGALPGVVEEACALITSLNPFPLDLEGRAAGNPVCPVREDLVIERSDTNWQVRTLGIEPECLHISRAYEQRLGRSQRGGLDRAERQHIEQAILRAQNFIEALRNRKQILLRIGAFLIERHAGFLATGDQRFLNPHSKAILAEALGVHESTISRATKGKFVRIATGETVPFSVFFKSAGKVQRMIEEILATENPASPLSDQQVAQLLEERGVRVARRTVNKYRDAARLLSSRRRRSA